QHERGLIERYWHQLVHRVGRCSQNPAVIILAISAGDRRLHWTRGAQQGVEVDRREASITVRDPSRGVLGTVQVGALSEKSGVENHASAGVQCAQIRRSGAIEAPQHWVLDTLDLHVTERYIWGATRNPGRWGATSISERLAVV